MWVLIRFLFKQAGILAFVTALAIEGTTLQAVTFTVTNANDTGLGSLRNAISNANAIVGVDLVNFNLSGTGPFTINLASPLPPLWEPVTIDGTSQPGYAGKPKIELNGASAGGDATGIYLQTSNCVVKGLAINRFTKEGIRIEGTGGNTIQGNFIGTGPFGTNALGNGYGSGGFGGITVLSAGNLIGGTGAMNRNVISGTNYHGVLLLDAGAVGNRITGNYIGLDITGSKPLGNLNHGIYISGAKSSVIGGTDSGAGNVISGNEQSGVYILGSSSTSNVVQGNFIGTDFSGTLAISNSSDGVTIHGGIGNIVGGTNVGAGNVISGNGGRGVLIDSGGATGNLIQGDRIGTSAGGTAKLGNALSGVEIVNASGNTVGGIVTGARNLISGNARNGVRIGDSGASVNLVQGNFIGTDVTGTNALGNLDHGVYLFGVASNVIGGSVPGAGNVISGNLQNGVYITDTNALARGNLVQGNLIGTDVTGLRQMGNFLSGVRVESPANTIGGNVSLARNVISCNTNNYEVYLFGITASNNWVLGNFIGPDATGMNALNTSTNIGVNINGAPANLVGGSTAGARNLISGNRGNGIFILGFSASNNIVQGNYIGTDLTGTNSLPNGLGLAPAGVAIAGGIDIEGAPSNLIGGTEARAGNLISGNWRDGVCIGNAGASNNVVQGNFIGTQPDGISPLGNETHNVDIRLPSSGNPGGANYNVIGGDVPGAGNTIAYTRDGGAGYDGIRIRNGVGNLIRGNSVFGNGFSAGALGIDLAGNGVTANDGAACDGDTGPNLLQNFPDLTNAVSGGSATRIQGTLNSAGSKTYLLQFYANTVAAVSGFGEGETYLGSTNVTTDASCNVSFSAILPVVVPVGRFISATATDPGNSTSEFSADVTVDPAQPPTITLEPQSQDVPFGSNVTFSVTASGTSPLNYQWHFNGTNIAGSTSSSLTLVNLQPTNAGNYNVTVSNPFGSTNSSTATLVVLFNLPNLSVHAEGSGQVNIAWPTNGPTFALWQTTNLVPPIAWTGVTNVTIVSNEQYVVTITPTGGNRFYRLALP